MRYTKHVYIWRRSMDAALKSGLWNFCSSMHLVHYKDQMTNNEKRQGSVCARMQAPKAWDILQASITKALILEHSKVYCDFQTNHPPSGARWNS